jgi:hypothetical protein
MKSGKKFNFSSTIWSTLEANAINEGLRFFNSPKLSTVNAEDVVTIPQILQEKCIIEKQFSSNSSVQYIVH